MLLARNGISQNKLRANFHLSSQATAHCSQNKEIIA